MKMNPVTWFEIPVTDMDRAEAFYTAVLGTAFNRQEEKEGMLMSWFPMDMEAMGAAGSLVKGEWFKPSMEGTMVYFTVPSIDETVEKVEANGGKVTFPKKDIGEHGFVAWFVDSEGNQVALHEAKDLSA